MEGKKNDCIILSMFVSDILCCITCIEESEENRERREKIQSVGNGVQQKRDQ